MIRINIGGTVYDFPEVGESPNWGKDATDVIVALADLVNTLFADGDILITRFNIANNTAVPAIINGLLFNYVQTASATVSYHVVRSTDDNKVTEFGSIYLNYDEDTSEWVMTRVIQSGDASLVFTIDATGQVSYQSNDLTGANYEGLIVFSAKTIPR